MKASTQKWQEGIGVALTNTPTRLFEIHDCLTLALDATGRPTGYSQSEREARSALRHVGKMMEGAA